MKIGTEKYYTAIYLENDAEKDFIKDFCDMVLFVYENTDMTVDYEDIIATIRRRVVQGNKKIDLKEEFYLK